MIDPAVTHSQRTVALDGLRALAVLAVLGFHTGVLDGGYIGVQMFFVLSGFLITSVLLGDVARYGRIRLRTFYGRRVRRLVPALAVVCVATFLLIPVTHDPAGPTAFGAATALTYTSNWFGAAMYYRGNLGHAWTLAIEEQFYLLWPVAMMFLLRRWSLRRVALLCAAVGAGSALLRAGLWALSPSATTATALMERTDTRLDGLMAGCGLALLLASAPQWRPSVRMARALGLGSLAVLVLIATEFRGPLSESVNDYGYAAAAVATAGLLMVLTRTSSGPLIRLLSSPALVLVGRLSYAVYLWWALVYVVLTPYVGARGLAPFLAIGLACMAVSMLSYQLVERRFLPAERRYSLAAATRAAVGLPPVQVRPSPRDTAERSMAASG